MISKITPLPVLLHQGGWDEILWFLVPALLLTWLRNKQNKENLNVLFSQLKNFYIINFVIEIKNLTMKYKNGKGVEDINISVDDGEVKALLGPNGSGKSTTMRSFMGFLNSSEGSLKVAGVDTIANPVEAKEIIGYLPGDPQLPQNLNSKSLFKLGADMRGQSIDYAMELAEKFELDVKQIVKELSKGNRQKTAVILALFHKPKALVLDEPTSGLDPFHQRTFFETIEEFSNNGASILLSSHIISEVEKIADTMAVLKVGSKIYDESYKTFEKKAKDEGKELEDAFFEFYDRKKE